MVGGIDGDERRAALGIDLRLDRQLLRSPASCDQPRIALRGRPRARRPNRRSGSRLTSAAKRRVVPAERRLQRFLLGGDRVRCGPSACGRAAALPRPARRGRRAAGASSRSRRPGRPRGYRRRSAASSRRSRSGLCTTSAKSRIVLKSDRSRLNAVADISRCQRTSQATVSVSAGVSPKRGHSSMRDLGAQHRMVAAAALGDVVEQHRDIEHAPRHDLLHDRRGERMILVELAALDPARAGRSRGWYARRRCSDGTCRTASARRRGRNRARSGRTRRPRSSSAAPFRDRAGWSARRGTARWRAGSRRTASSISLASRAAARIASGWISSPCLSASANISISRTGSFAKKSSRGHREPAALERRSR